MPSRRCGTIDGMETALAAGTYVREWRRRRRMSQMELALEAEISTRHLSFVETGRSQPSREMILRLADRLEIPLRERNALLLAAGFAPVYPQRRLEDPALDAVHKAIQVVLKGHEPYPAIAVDRHWTLVASNDSAMRLLSGVAPRLLEPPINVLRISLHPEGIASRIANLASWRAHVLERLRRQIAATADQRLEQLLGELQTYPSGTRSTGEFGDTIDEYGGVVVPLRLISDAGVLSFFTTTTVFGTPLDVTVAELAIEAFFPADAATGDALRKMAAP
jgi:transcriptional regulator with XRE-family HTH domain